MGYYLEKNLPDYHVSISILTETSWQKFSREMYNENGWDARLAKDRTLKSNLGQLIWYNSGELIGDANDYMTFVEHAYGINEGYLINK